MARIDSLDVDAAFWRGAMFGGHLHQSLFHGETSRRGFFAVLSLRFFVMPSAPTVLLVPSFRHKAITKYAPPFILFFVSRTFCSEALFTSFFLGALFSFFYSHFFTLSSRWLFITCLFVVCSFRVSFYEMARVRFLVSVDSASVATLGVSEAPERRCGEVQEWTRLESKCFTNP